MADAVTHKGISNTLVPWLLSIVSGLLAWIVVILYGMSNTLSVAVTRVESHGVRLDKQDEVNARQDVTANDHERRISLLEHIINVLQK